MSFPFSDCSLQINEVKTPGRLWSWGDWWGGIPSNRCPGKLISFLKWEALSFVQDTEQRVDSEEKDLVGDTDSVFYSPLVGAILEKDVDLEERGERCESQLHSPRGNEGNDESHSSGEEADVEVLDQKVGLEVEVPVNLAVALVSGRLTEAELKGRTSEHSHQTERKQREQNKEQPRKTKRDTRSHWLERRLRVRLTYLPTGGWAEQTETLTGRPPSTAEWSSCRCIPGSSSSGNLSTLAESGKSVWESRGMRVPCLRE